MTTSDDVPSPTDPSRPVSAADRQAFDAMVDQALPAVRSMAAAWRTGLAGLITLVTTGVILTGRTATAELTPPWLVAVTVAVGGGIACAVVGLWQALAAEVGSRATPISLADILARHASVRAYQAGVAAAASRRLQNARLVVALSLALLLTGVVLTWWAPRAPASPPGYLTVSYATSTVCGRLLSADGGVVRLAVPGAHDSVAVPVSAITNLAVTATCP